MIINVLFRQYERQATKGRVIRLQNLRRHRANSDSEDSEDSDVDSESDDEMRDFIVNDGAYADIHVDQDQDCHWVRPK